MNNGNKSIKKSNLKEIWHSLNLLRGAITYNNYELAIMSVLFLKLINIIDNTVNSPENNKKFILPNESKFDFLVSQSNSPGNNERFKIALKMFFDKNIKVLNDNFNFLFNNEKHDDIFFRETLDIINNINISTSIESVFNESGEVFEFFINQFAIFDSKNSGQTYTQPSVNRLLALLIKPENYNSVYDPACGTGSLLLKCSESINTKNSYKLFGQEINLKTLAIAKMNMFLHNDFTNTLTLGDSLLNPQFIDDNGELMKFDIVISNPPISQSNWGYNELQHDKFNRFEIGMPPKFKGDFAFILHMIKSMNNTGRMAIIASHGVLFRSGSEYSIRKRLIDENLLDAVISLPVKLLYGTSIPIVILIFKKIKPNNEIKFIDVSNEYISGKNVNYLNEETIKRIVSTYHGEDKNDILFHLASQDEVRENDYNLSVARYIKPKEKSEKVNLRSLKYDSDMLKNKLVQLESEMDIYLTKWI